MFELLKEFTQFIRERRKYWLIPILLILFMFGSVVFLTQGTAVAPFIYTIF